MIVHGTVLEKNSSVSKIKIGDAGCESCGKCGKYRQKIITADDTTEAAVGDRVEVLIFDKKYNLSILLFYVLPLIALVIGIFTGYYIISPHFSPNLVDIISVSCGIILTAIVYLVLRIFKNRLDSSLGARVISIE